MQNPSVTQERKLLHDTALWNSEEESRTMKEIKIYYSVRTCVVFPEGLSSRTDHNFFLVRMSATKQSKFWLRPTDTKVRMNLSIAI